MLNRWVLNRDRKTARPTGGAEVTRSDCSRREQRRPEKLGHRQSGAADNQWTVTKMNWNEVADDNVWSGRQFQV